MSLAACSPAEKARSCSSPIPAGASTCGQAPSTAPAQLRVPLAQLQQQPGQQQQPAPLQALFDEVSTAFAAQRTAGIAIGAHQPADSAARLDAAVRAAVAKYHAAGHDDWRALASFCDTHYVRHLVDESQDLEMILIAWKRGQVSRIHNHGQSHCWLTVLGGGVEELRYSSGDTPVAAGPALAPRLPGVIEATTPCPLLVPVGCAKVGPGQTAYINDGLGLHAVRCDDGACGEGEEGAVSLHIYAPPIRRVRLYEPEHDRVTVRAPGFQTIRGKGQEALQQLSHMSSSL